MISLSRLCVFCSFFFFFVEQKKVDTFFHNFFTSRADGIFYDMLSLLSRRAKKSSTTITTAVAGAGRSFFRSSSCSSSSSNATTTRTTTTEYKQLKDFFPATASSSSSSSSSSSGRTLVVRDDDNSANNNNNNNNNNRRRRRTAYIETYGCQMNTSDSEVVMSVLTANGYDIIDSISAAEKKKKKKKNEVKDEEEEDDDGEEQVPSTATMPEVILVNTCAIRDKAEERVKTRLRQFRSMKTTSPSSSVFSKDFNISNNNNNNNNKKAVIGVLGCMGERIKGELLKKDSKGVRLADIVAGPDSYRDLPRLIENAISSSNNDNRQSKKNTNDGGNESLVTSSSSRKRFEPKITETMNVELSTTETYSEIFPMRRGKVEDMSTSAFVTIQRGCDNMCAFCIVPFTRGRERSRDSASILEEAKKRFYEENAREIVLLGQNVNSYSDKTYVVAAAGKEENSSSSNTAARTTTSNGVYAEGFKSVYVPSRNQEYDFAKLLKDVCAISPELRVRFTSPHPKDFPDNLLQTIAETPNASKLLHMPAQSGSTTALERMNRGYSREAYLNLIDKAKAIIPDVAFSSDFISGFCGETEEEHNDTLSLLKRVQYEQAFTFAYSLRDKTAASKKLIDDVPEEVKQRRLAEVIETFREAAKEKAKGEIGKTHLVLVEGTSKRDDEKCTGRADNGKRVVFMNENGEKSSKKGEYVEVRIREAGVNTLIGDFVKKTTAKAFYEANGGKAWYA